MFQCRRKILGSADLQETSFYQQYSPKIFIHGQRPTEPHESGAKGARKNKVSPQDMPTSKIKSDAQNDLENQSDTVGLDVESLEIGDCAGAGIHVHCVVPSSTYLLKAIVFSLFANNRESEFSVLHNGVLACYQCSWSLIDNDSKHISLDKDYVELFDSRL